MARSKGAKAIICGGRGYGLAGGFPETMLEKSWERRQSKASPERRSLFRIRLPQADTRNELRDALSSLSRNVRRRLPTSVSDSFEDDKTAMVHGKPRNLVVIDVD